MTLPLVLDIAYASLIEDISPPLSRLGAREKIDEILDAQDVNDLSTWGTSPEAQAGQEAMMKLAGA